MWYNKDDIIYFNILNWVQLYQLFLPPALFLVWKISWLPYFCLYVCLSVCLSVLVCLCPCAHFSFTVSLLVCPPLSTSINDSSLLLWLVSYVVRIEKRKILSDFEFWTFCNNYESVRTVIVFGLDDDNSLSANQMIVQKNGNLI